MPRVATGGVYWHNGAAYARLTIDKRIHVKLATCQTPEQASARQAILAELAKALRAGGQGGELGEKILKRAAAAPDGKPLESLRTTARALLAEKIQGPSANASAASTFGEVADLWTSGALAKRHPDYVKAKRSAESDVHRLKHVLPVVGDVSLASFTLDDADRVMAMLPPMSTASRRHVAQVIHRVLALAVFPLKLRAASPIPAGWLPKLGAAPAKAYLYPDEDARLLGCEQVDLCWRMVYGFLHREGMRRSEALTLQWRDLDLRRGAVVLDKNKTDDPRAWALRTDVVEALCAWWVVCGQPDHDARVFVDTSGHPLTDDHTADRYRADLERAGVDRPQLFEKSSARRRITFHDTRATFVTLALAQDKTEAWISDRTGHRSSDQIAKYHRSARTVRELALGPLLPLAGCIPELAPAALGRAQKAVETAAGARSPWRSDAARSIQVPAG